MASTNYVAEIETDQAGYRLDVYLTQLLQKQIHIGELSRSQVQKIIQQVLIKVNGQNRRPSYKLRLGDQVSLCLSSLESIYAPEELHAELIPIPILFQDEHLAVLDKPAGLVVQPTEGLRKGTLVNGLLYYFGDKQRTIERQGLVHRLDKDTTGVIVVAKSQFAFQHLSAQFKAHSTQRTYQAVVCGQLKNESGTISAPLGRSKKDFRQMMVVDGGRRAVTHYQVLDRLDRLTLLQLQLETGRTHQIRVHLSTIGHPIVGDLTYGGGAKRGCNEATSDRMRQILSQLNRQALHAQTLGFIHPLTEQIHTFTSQTPTDLKPLMDCFHIPQDSINPS